LCTEVRGGVTHSVNDRSEYRLNQVNIIGIYIVAPGNEYLLIFYDNRESAPLARRQAATVMPTLATTFQTNGSSREYPDDLVGSGSRWPQRIECRIRSEACNVSWN
jgi:hypothetical protein